MKRKKETIVVFSAHSDDFVLGAGGTIAKYAQKKSKIFCIVFSYGEKSHPWMKKNIIKEVRAQEAFKASAALGCKTKFLDLREGQFYEDYQYHNKKSELLTFLRSKKPSKIFTHSEEDPHPDHRAVHKITIELYQALGQQPRSEVYAYSIWNPVSFKSQYPSFYVDISSTFSLKRKAIRLFSSQKVHIALLTYFLVPYRAVKDGFRVTKLFGEQFFRIR